mgnify:CR=1 FL=1
MAHHRLPTSADTPGVKYRPSAAPIAHCPPLRSGPQLSVGAPAMDSTDVATRGPSIQGSGVCSATQAAAAAQASSRVPATRSRNFTDIGAGKSAEKSKLPSIALPGPVARQSCQPKPSTLRRSVDGLFEAKSASSAYKESATSY